MRYLSVRNFEHFQHYRDRSPVWIKLYNAVMDDEAFLALSDAARGQLMLIWLLASRRENKIPNDARAVARAIQATGRVDLQRFVSAGFLIPYQEASGALAEVEKSASTVLAEPERSASPHVRPRARGEAETELEAETEASSAGTGEFDAIAELLARIPASSRPAWAAELSAAEQGMHGPPLAHDSVVEACRDYLGNGALEQPSLRHFRAYLASAGRPKRAARTIAVTTDDAGRAFAAIRALVREVRNPGRGMIRTLPKSEVEKLGATVLAAYEQIGGADRFLDPDEKVGFILRDFTNAYRAALPTSISVNA